MSVNINVISIANKTFIIKDLEGNIITSNVSNENINLHYTDSYIIYVSPEITEIGYTGFLNLSNNILSGFYGYIWIIVILFIFFYLIKGAKNHVKQ